MKKIKEVYIENEYYRYYQLDDISNYKDILYNIKESEINIREVTIDEDLDWDMKTIEGSWEFDTIVNDFDDMLNLSFDISSVSIHISGDYKDDDIMISIHLAERLLSLLTKDAELELDALIKI